MIEGSIGQKVIVGISELIDFEVIAILSHKTMHSVGVVRMVLEYRQLNRR